MNISPNTLETLQRLPRKDSLLLDTLYSAQSLEQAIEIVTGAAERQRIAIDRDELTIYLESSLAADT